MHPPTIHIFSPPHSQHESGPHRFADFLSDEEELGYRTQYLHPPPQALTLHTHRQSMPMCNSGTPTTPIPPPRLRESKRQADLRVAIARKVHTSKQAERRARFLAKVGAPPSPNAVFLPPTPPDSPALFHFSLPSPGMTSPLPLFQSLRSDRDSPVNYRLEQVNFRAQMPSLEEISSHFNLPPSHEASRPSITLPKFLDNYSKDKSTHLQSAALHGRSTSLSNQPRSWLHKGRAFLTESNLRSFDRTYTAIPVSWH